MYERCRQEIAEAYQQATVHMDAQGVPDDSLYRKLVLVEMACNFNPDLDTILKSVWPTATALMQ